MKTERKYAVKICCQEKMRFLKLLKVPSKNLFDYIKKEVGCEYLDVARAPLLNDEYDLWVDDEGGLKELPVSMHNGFQYLYGNIVIMKTDDNGDILPLTLTECKLIATKFKNRFGSLRWTEEYLKENYDFNDRFINHLLNIQSNFICCDQNTTKIFKEMAKIA